MDVLGEKLAELADKLGVSVEALWPMMVEKVVVDWWVGAAILFVLWIPVFFCVRWAIPHFKEDNSWALDCCGISDTGAVFSVLMFLVILFLSIPTLIHIGGISTLFYPEVSALNEIIRLLGK